MIFFLSLFVSLFLEYELLYCPCSFCFLQFIVHDFPHFVLGWFRLEQCLLIPLYVDLSMKLCNFDSLGIESRVILVVTFNYYFKFAQAV